MTRIIAGIHKGKKLSVPSGTDIRPTTDRMRERLFSILFHDKYPTMQGARVADIFAGTGALGLEAISRGALHATFVEKAPASIKCLQDNIKSVQGTASTQILRSDALRLPGAASPYDFIFLDAPYRAGLTEPTIGRLLDGRWLSPDGVIIAEMHKAENFTPDPRLQIVDDRTQGIQRLVILGFAV